jgi:hypothetical protein
MSAFAATLLDVWETGYRQPPARQALAVLAGCLKIPAEVAAACSVGERDQLLMTARQSLLGWRLPTRADCPACGELLELNLDLREFLSVKGTEPRSELLVDSLRVIWRLPTAGDLADVATFDSTEGARRELLSRCIVSVRELESDAIVAPSEWTDAVGEAVEVAIERAAPESDFWIHLNCPACGHSWKVMFDIVTYFWSELDFLAQQLLAEVHQLATAYGWHEQQILAMSARRRAAYLEMCGA